LGFGGIVVGGWLQKEKMSNYLAELEE